MKVWIEGKESQLLNYIKLHMTVCVPFCTHALSFRTVVDPFITFSAISEALEEL